MNFSKEYIKLHGRQILDSRGEPTVEVELYTKCGIFRSSCPSGKSTGKFEAYVSTDGGDTYDGKSVKHCVKTINTIIAPILEKFDIEFGKQEKFDDKLREIDGTSNFSKYGANAMLPISMCYARASAYYKKIHMVEYIFNLSKISKAHPIPQINFNILNGGKHSNNSLVFQEIMINFPNSSLEMVLEKAEAFYNELENVIIREYGHKALMVGDEAGFAPPIRTLEEGLDLLYKTNLSLNYDFRIAIDAAANSFYDGTYNFTRTTEGEVIDVNYSTDELCEYYKNLLKKHNKIYLIEDPFNETDYKGWSRLTKETDILIVGDDLCATNPVLIETAISNEYCNSILIKPNQIGSVSLTISAINMSRKHGFPIMVSHRSGETEDVFIVDFAVGVGAEYVKFGAPRRGERIAKYNELLRILEYFTTQ
ncbi:Enolase [Cucumispora dikerogammari]|nr:Enolase [Cucumispora dikerogammari]